jgi:hypothetical protein
MNPPDIRKSSRLSTTLLGFAGAALALACGTVWPFNDTRSPAEHARDLEPRCNGLTEESSEPFLARSSVDSVEPAYSFVKSGPNDREARLRGARVHVKPLPGLTRESLALRLECHQARATLGAVQAGADDPYVLPGRWLDIGVESTGDGFVALVQIDEFDDAKQVLERARRFSGARTAE